MLDLQRLTLLTYTDPTSYHSELAHSPHRLDPVYGPPLCCLLAREPHRNTYRKCGHGTRADGGCPAHERARRRCRGWRRTVSRRLGRGDARYCHLGRGRPSVNDALIRHCALKYQIQWGFGSLPTGACSRDCTFSRDGIVCRKASDFGFNNYSCRQPPFTESRVNYQTAGSGRRGGRRGGRWGGSWIG